MAWEVPVFERVFQDQSCSKERPCPRHATSSSWAETKTPRRRNAAGAWTNASTRAARVLKGNQKRLSRRGSLHAGALVGYVIFTLGLGIGDTDIFDWGGLFGALIGTVIVVGLASYFLRRRQPRPMPAASSPQAQRPQAPPVASPPPGQGPSADG